jgi:hypothetical protein
MLTRSVSLGVPLEHYEDTKEPSPSPPAHGEQASPTETTTNPHKPHPAPTLLQRSFSVMAIPSELTLLRQSSEQSIHSHHAENQVPVAQPAAPTDPLSRCRALLHAYLEVGFCFTVVFLFLTYFDAKTHPCAFVSRDPLLSIGWHSKSLPGLEA